MATKHILTCDCGKEHPIETFQAGQTLLCECGKTLKIPSMLHIKKLPLFEESDPAAPAEPSGKRNSGEKAPKEDVEQKADSSASNTAAPPRKSSERTLSGSRLGIFIVGIALLLVLGFLLFRTLMNPPVPTQVFQKQRDFIQNGTVVHRDSLPVTPEDFAFYINDQAEPGQWVLVNDIFIEQRMSPYMLCDYFNLLKDGPRLSDNFYENYEILKTTFRMKVVLYIVLLVLSAVVCLLPWLLPKKRTTVGAIRGAEWKV